MLLPNKHINLEQSLIATGAKILPYISINGNNVSELWQAIKEQKEIKSFEQYTIGLSFLFMVGIITFNENMIRKII